MSNPWISFVKDYQKKSGKPYRVCLRECSGLYREHKKKQDGEGLRRTIRLTKERAVKVLESRPKKLRKLLRSHGGRRIVRFTVCRTPVESAIKKALNLFSFGAFKKVVMAKNYDDLMHLMMVMHFVDGSRVSIEKNEVTKIVYNPKKRKGAECKPSPPVNITLSEMIKKSENIEGGNLYRYDPAVYNCQRFIKTLLNVSGVHTLDSFVLQDFADVFKANPVLHKFARGLTDVAALGRRALGAGAVQN